jgi:hypothetical protein
MCSQRRRPVLPGLRPVFKLQVGYPAELGGISHHPVRSSRTGAGFDRRSHDRSDAPTTTSSTGAGLNQARGEFVHSARRCPEDGLGARMATTNRRTDVNPEHNAAGRPLFSRVSCPPTGSENT